jgi:excisionase family DNA binding protein
MPASRDGLDALPDIFDVRDAAAYLDVSDNTVYEAIRRGEFPSVRLGRRIRIPKAAFVRWLEGPDDSGTVYGTLSDGTR